VAGSPRKGENIGERGLGSVTYDVAFKKHPDADDEVMCSDTLS